MSEIERFDVLVFGSGQEVNSLPGSARRKVCGQRSWNAALRWIMPEYRLPADENVIHRREGGRLCPS